MYVGRSAVAGIAAIVCALVVMAGSFAPWFRIGSFISFESEAVYGFEVRGAISFGAALVALGFVGFQLFSRRGEVLVAVAAFLIAVLVALWSWATKDAQVDDFGGDRVDIGFGLPVVILAGVVGLLCSIQQLVWDRDDPKHVHEKSADGWGSPPPRGGK